MSEVTCRHFEAEITWRETGDAEFPYQASADGKQLTIRLNDFPEEPLYTLLVEDLESGHFDDWPATWRKNARPGQGASARSTVE